MKKLFTLALFIALLSAAPAEAAVPGLQVNPLQYEDTLSTAAVKLGHIEVSNPSDATITLESRVQGFRQADNAGRLSFFDDPEISAGIKVDLPKFDLGAREAIRVAFSVDPAKLPKGGVYAVIFFRTIPPAQSSGSSYVAESANIGTLLLLQNGGSGVHFGQISRLDLPFWHFGQGISGTLDYRNTDRSPTPAGFKPVLFARVVPWGSSPRVATGLVLPGSERRFAVTRPGSYFGLLPVTVTDSGSQKYVTRWVFAVTGWYQWLALLLLLLAAVLIALKPRRLTSAIHKLLRRLKRQPRLEAPRAKRSLDGLASRPAPAALVSIAPKLDPADHPTPTRELVAQILKRYGVTQFTYEPATSGIENTTVLVATPGARLNDLVIRLYRQGKAINSKIETELEFMKLLAEANIPVPAVRPDRKGHYFGEAQSSGRSWHYIVMDRAGGAHPAEYTYELLDELASYQARLHQLGYDFAKTHPPANHGPRELVETFGDRIDPATIVDPAVAGFLDRAKHFQVLLPAELPSGYTHLDLDKENILAEAGAITAILDFDDLDYAPSVKCLGYTLWDILEATDDLAMVQHYLKQYALVRPLADGELDFLPEVMLFRHYAVGVIDIAISGVHDDSFAEVIKIEQTLLQLVPSGLIGEL